MPMTMWPRMQVAFCLSWPPSSSFHPLYSYTFKHVLAHLLLAVMTLEKGGHWA